MMKTVTLFLLSLLLGGSSLVEAQLDSSIFIGCGNTTTCFMTVPSSCDTECTGPNDCDLVAVIEDIPAESKFRIQLHSGRGYSYMALGFSTDRLMDSSDVVGCDRTDANTAFAKDTYNVEGRRNTYDADQSTISNFWFNITGNMFSCQFDRTYLSPPNTGFALNGTFILFLGARSVGFSAMDSRFERHSKTPCMSSAPVNLLVPNPVLSSGRDFTLVKAHGILMLFAWMVLVPIAIFMAGYTKYIFPNGEWFHAHRILNISAIATTLAGIAIIFIYVEGWSSGSASILVHQILGFAVIFTMLLNPVVALFRCSPKSQLRWIFCLLHSFLGYGAESIAITALFLGLIVYSARFANKRSFEFVFAFWILVGWVVIIIILYISLIFYKIFRCKCQDQQEDTFVKEKPKSENYLSETLKHNFLCLPLCLPLSERKKAAKEWPFIGALLLAFIVFSFLCFVGCLLSIVLVT